MIEGQLVLVVQQVHGTRGCSWVPEMDQWVGTVGRVATNGTATCRVHTGRQGQGVNSWSYPVTALMELTEGTVTVQVWKELVGL